MRKSLEHLLDGITLGSDGKQEKAIDEAHDFLMGLDKIDGGMSNHALAYGANGNVVITMRPSGYHNNGYYCNVRFTGDGQPIVDVNLYAKADNGDFMFTKEAGKHMSIDSILDMIRSYGLKDEDEEVFYKSYNPSTAVLVDPGDDLIEIIDKNFIECRNEMTKTRDEVVKSTSDEIKSELSSDHIDKAHKEFLTSILNAGEDAILGYAAEQLQCSQSDYDEDDEEELGHNYYDKDYNYWKAREMAFHFWSIPALNRGSWKRLVPSSSLMNGKQTVKDAISVIQKPSKRFKQFGHFIYKPVGKDMYVVRDVLEKEELNPDARVFFISIV